MSHNTSYPSPTAAQVGDGAGPFYTQQSQRMPAQEELELSAHLAREIGPNMTHNNSSSMEQGQQHADQKYSQLMFPPHGHQQMMGTPGPSGLNMTHMNNMNNNLGNMSSMGNMNNNEDSATKKKGKVSRACDECRRKKIRCDADSEGQSHEKCTNCKRTSAACEFSRVPMKRGPSKGYIKELSDRVDQLEQQKNQQLGALGSSHSSPYGLGEFDRAHELSSGKSRKRTHSDSERPSQQGFLHNQLQAAASGWHGQDSFQPHQAYSRTTPQAPFAEMSYTPLAQNSTMTTNGITQAMIASEIITATIQLTPAEEGLFASYMTHVHSTFPILGNTPEIVAASLIGSTGAARDGLFGSLYMLLRLVNPEVSHPITDPEEIAAQFLTSFRATSFRSRSFQANLVSISTFIFIVLSLDTFGPDEVHPSTSTERVAWFALANEVADHLRLPSVISSVGVELIDVSRRLRWILVIIDRFHAIGNATTMRIPESITNLTPEDKALLGEEFSLRVRIAQIMEALSNLLHNSPQVMIHTRAQDAYVRPLLALQLQLLMDILPYPTLDTYPGLWTPYWFTHLVYELVMAPAGKPTLRLVDCGLSLKDHIAFRPWTPLHHHYITLCGKMMIELSNSNEHRAEVSNDLAGMVELIERRAVRLPGEALVAQAIKTKLAALQSAEQASLQNLADAAVGETVDSDEDESKFCEWRRIITDGFHHAFVDPN